MALPSASRIDFADITAKRELARKSEQRQTGPVEESKRESVREGESRERARTRRGSKEARSKRRKVVKS